MGACSRFVAETAFACPFQVSGLPGLHQSVRGFRNSRRPVARTAAKIVYAKASLPSRAENASFSLESTTEPSWNGDTPATEALAAAVASTKDVLVVGRGRGGRVRSIIAGIEAQRARSTLVLAPTRLRAEALAAEAQAAWKAAEVMEVCNFGSGNGQKNISRSAPKGEFSVLVGTPAGVGDAFLGDGQSASWLQTLDVFVLYDVRILAELSSAKMLRKLARIATESGGTQVVVVVDSLEKLPDRVIGPNFLRAGEHISIPWGDNCGNDAVALANISSLRHRFGSVLPRHLVPALAELLRDCFSGKDELEKYKVVVFFQAARLAQYFAELFLASGVEVYEVHSSKTKKHNELSLVYFNAFPQGLLFTTERMSRGAEIANIDRVIHVGLPLGPEQYEARLLEVIPGGTSLTLLLGYEVPAFFSRGVLSAFLSEKTAVARRVRDLGRDAISEHDMIALQKARESIAPAVKEGAYASWLRTHDLAREELGWTREQLLQRGWQWARDIAGLEYPPVLPARMVDDLGLRGVKGMLVDDGEDREEVRKRGVERKPDVNGKYKKRKPRGRWFYSPARFNQLR